MALAVLVIIGSLAGDGSLQGIVVDWQEARIPGAQVLVVGKRLKGEMRTDAKGEFEIQLPAGKYRVEVRTPGFKPFVKKGIKIPDGAPVSLRIPLSVVQFNLKCPRDGVCL